jgi:hypothetical protein
VLPAAALGLELGGEVTVLPRLLVGAGLVVSAETEAALGPGHVKTRLFAARASACLTHGLGRVTPRGCLALVGGRVAAAGAGYDTSLAAAAFWAAAALRAELRFALASRLDLLLALEGFGALARPVLDLEGAEGRVVASRRLDPVGGQLALGAAWRF